MEKHGFSTIELALVILFGVLIIAGVGTSIQKKSAQTPAASLLTQPGGSAPSGPSSGTGTAPTNTLPPAIQAQPSILKDYAVNNPMVHQVGDGIVDPGGKPLKLRGVNLAGWLQWEGFLWGKGILTSRTAIVNGLTKLVGADQTTAFTNQIYDSYITEDDIRAIAAAGFNSVRVNFNYRVLSDQNQWSVLDNLLSWCEKYHIYAILDMHAIPGGQSKVATADPADTSNLVWSSSEDQAATAALWKQIAARYHNRSIIAGYDLINEPQTPSGQASVLPDFYQQITKAIREADPYHMVILEGDKLATDFSAFSKPISSNQMYSFHMYTWFGDNRQKLLDGYKQVATNQHIPMWVGEFGENSYAMIASTAALYNDPANDVNGGWAYFTWKRAPTSYPGLAVITIPGSWQSVMNWIVSPLFNKKPTAAAAATGMQDFVNAVKLANTPVDQQMAGILK